jgi:hypothetical protein
MSAGFSRKPFGSLENSATISRQNKTQLRSPGNYLNPSKPAGSGNMNNISPACTNNIINNFNKTCNLKTRIDNRELEPPAKRCATSTTNTSSVQKQTSNTNKQRISNDYSNQQGMNIGIKRDCRDFQRYDQCPKDVNSPKGFDAQAFNGNNIRSYSPGTSSASNTSLNSRNQPSSSNFKTPDNKNNHRQSMNSRKKQAINTPGYCDASGIAVTPSRKKSSRKFPGPAGLLPKLVSISISWVEF